MNGVHDMGGMQGFGPVEAEGRDEPVFHAPWEGRVFAMRILMGAWRKWNIDAGRHSIERFAPADYLRWSYYEKWFHSLRTLSCQAGLISQRELESGRPDPGGTRQTAPLGAAQIPDMVARGGPTTRETAVRPSFGAGDRVRARNLHPKGHTRLPAYVRGHVGVVERDHGAHVFPDANAHFKGESPGILYTVRFAARELWGETAHPADAVLVDLWEAYLEPGGA